MPTQIETASAKLDRIRAIDIELSSLKDQSSLLSKERQELEKWAIDFFLDLGTDNMKRDSFGGYTAYRDVRVAASPKYREDENPRSKADQDRAHERLAKVLRKLRAGSLCNIRIHSGSLGAWVREYLEDHDEIPPELDAVANITYPTKIKTVKTNIKKTAAKRAAARGSK